MEKWLKPLELIGDTVRLAPLEKAHEKGILEAALDGKLWELWYTSVPSSQTVQKYMSFAFKEFEAGRSLPFVVFHKQTGKVIGMSRYCNATPEHRRLEIGYTWYAKSFQRTAVNTECKLLLLSHAFERLKCIAVEFRTHWHNHRSRQAISRLGAKQDGILRNHRIEGGALRDTVVFSIVESEWPTVKRSLKYHLGRYETQK